MGNTFFRETWAEINLDAIEYNIKKMREKLPATTQITAVVKANGYGHGSVQIAKKALESGASALAVALLEEALVLREAGITAPILVLSWVSPKGALVAAEQDIMITFFQDEWIHSVESLHLKKDLKVHLKWDTGMGRVGIQTENELKQILQSLNESSHIHLTGVYTHFATADATDTFHFNQQKARFDELLGVFNQLWTKPVDVHIGNSAAAIRHPENMHHFIRYGISMYGLYPSQAVKEERSISLKQAFSLHSRIIHVKKVSKGSCISYGSTYVCKDEEWIGTIPIGYGDGWSRKLQGADVLVEGKRFPIIGRICMDQMMIRLDKSYPIGTKVTLIGEQLGEVIEMDEVAKYLDTINYEIPFMLNNRVPRIYIENNKE